MELIGNIDKAHFRSVTDSVNEARIIGWILSTEGALKRLECGIAGHEMLPAKKVIRTDVAEKLPTIAHAVGSGFTISFEYPSYLGNVLEVKCRAELLDGRVISSQFTVKLEELSGDESTASSVCPAKELNQDFFRAHLDLFLAQKLKIFLNSGATLGFAGYENPEISVIMPVFNHAEYTYQCIESIQRQEGVSYELIVLDNCSSDETQDLLARTSGVKVLREDVNLHFLLGSNKAACAAKGKYLLFVNSDTVLMPGAMRAALDVFQHEKNCGAVGGRLIHPDGRLQEAGSRLFNDGSAIGIGVADDPFSPMYSYQREVDFCSAAFLMTPRDLFFDFDSFDAAYEPAYYEDADYCVRLKEAGYASFFTPDAIVMHFEYGSSDGKQPAFHMEINRGIFVSKHHEFLKSMPGSPESAAVSENTLRRSRGRIFVFDDMVPRKDLGQGLPRSLLVLNGLARHGFSVSLITLNQSGTVNREDYHDLDPHIRILEGIGRDDIGRFLKANQEGFDYIFVSRPANLKAVSEGMVKASLKGSVPLIYDAEAIFASREIGHREIETKLVFTEEEKDFVFEEEMKVVRSADLVLSLGKQDRLRFEKHGIFNLQNLGFAVVPNPTPRSFCERKGFLTVGPMIEEDTPNSDAVVWFNDNVRPIIAGRLGPDQMLLRLAGKLSAQNVMERLDSGLESLGVVADLYSVFNSHKVFVAATRFSAGVPLKVIEAASFGLPVVCTSLLLEQLGWEAERDLLVADTAEEFSEQCARLYIDESLWYRIRNTALDRVREEYSAGNFDKQMQGLYEWIQRR